MHNFFQVSKPEISLFQFAFERFAHMVGEDILEADKEVRAVSVDHLWTAFIEALHKLAEHGVQFSYRASLLKL